MLSTFVRFTYRLSKFLRFVNVLQNSELRIHCVGYLKTKNKSFVMAV